MLQTPHMFKNAVCLRKNWQKDSVTKMFGWQFIHLDRLWIDQGDYFSHYYLNAGHLYTYIGIKLGD